jgi:hypothetical protein
MSTSEHGQPVGSNSNASAGDRTKDSLLEFAEALVPSAGQPHRYVKGVTRMAKTPGCNLSGATAVIATRSRYRLLPDSPCTVAS